MVLILYLSASGQDYTAIADGNWSAEATWSRSATPSPVFPGNPLNNTTSSVTIGSAFTVVIDNNMDFMAGSPTFTINGDLYILGDVTFSTGTMNISGQMIVQGNLTLTGAATINNSGTFVVTGDMTVNAGADFFPGGQSYVYGTPKLEGGGEINNGSLWGAYGGSSAAAFGAVGNCASNPALCAFANNAELPVTLTYFKGFMVNNDVVLRWATASESNSDQFIVERSVDGHHFEDIGSVKAAGYSTANIEYTFTDKHQQAGRYYRLRQIDFDERFYYSGIVHLNLKGNASQVKFYPNPSFKGQSINIELSEDTSNQIHIFSIDGKTELVNTLVEGKYFRVDLGDQVQPGLYVINVVSESTRFSDLILIK